MTFDSRRLRNALGHFPTGVIVLTTVTDDGERLGMTMSSFNSVSLDPPLVVFSIHRQAVSLAKWRTARHYAINVLSEDQEELSNRFARPKSAKWEGLSPIDGQFGAPLLPNVPVAFECETYARHEGGDHDLFLARVLAIHENPHAQGRPLLFAAGRYGQLRDGSGHAAPIDSFDHLGWVW